MSLGRFLRPLCSPESVQDGRLGEQIKKKSETAVVLLITGRSWTRPPVGSLAATLHATCFIRDAPEAECASRGGGGAGDDSSWNGSEIGFAGGAPERFGN